MSQVSDKIVNVNTSHQRSIYEEQKEEVRSDNSTPQIGNFNTQPEVTRILETGDGQ